MTKCLQILCASALLVLLLPSPFEALPNQIKIAAIFDENQDRKHELAFKYGIQRVNRDNSILPGKYLVPEIVRVPTGNR